MEKSNMTFLGKGDADETMSQGTTWIVKGGDDMKSEQSSYMVRGGANQGDDLSSQGSYMIKVGGMGQQRSESQADGGFTDMQSEGSYMVRGFNGQVGNQPIFNDDESENDGSFIRQSQNSFINVDSEAAGQKSKISEKSDDDELEETTAKFTS